MNILDEIDRRYATDMYGNNINDPELELHRVSMSLTMRTIRIIEGIRRRLGHDSNMETVVYAVILAATLVDAERSGKMVVLEDGKGNREKLVVIP